VIGGPGKELDSLSARFSNPTGTNPSEFLGDATVVSAFGSLFGAAKRVADAWCCSHSVQNGASGCSRKQRHPGAFTGAAFAGPKIAAFVGAFAGPETTGANVLARLEIGEAAEISLEIYSGERKDAKVATIVSALAGRSVLISLVSSVAEADVATVDGLESTTKSTRDRKRYKLAIVNVSGVFKAGPVHVTCKMRLPCSSNPSSKRAGASLLPCTTMLSQEVGSDSLLS
ncbi:hypothetical protein BHM03_00025292, partial [Ensete ventricosum]